MSTAASPATTEPKPLRVFISFSHSDDKLRKKFVNAISPLLRQGLIEVWHDRKILPGDQWKGVIDDRLNSADIVVLLVSNEFLASDYCYEIELQTALQMHEAGLARVIPVILKPCYWQGSPFGKLGALPEDGKPVASWKSLEDGLLNVVLGLLAVVNKSAKVQAAVKPEEVRKALRSRRWPLVAAVVALVALMAGAFGLVHQRQIQQAAALVTQGNEFLEDRNWSEAERTFTHAKDLDPNNSAAYAGLGMLYSLEKDPAAAINLYETAVKLSPQQPAYQINLADAYFSTGDYEKALDKYAGIADSPYAAISSAKIFRLMGADLQALQKAATQNRVALTWLNDPQISNLPENKLEWSLATDTKLIKVINQSEKLCYAQLELALTLSLLDNETESKQYREQGRQSCGDRLPGIVRELRYEIDQLNQEHPEFTARSSEFIKRFS